MNLYTEPWWELFGYEFMREALVVGVVVAAMAAVLSCFLILKGWSLMGDAVSHAVLPGIVLASMLAMPKLLAKVTVVGLLTLNGYYLHHRFFNRLGHAVANFRRAVNLTALMAAVSGASWMFAAFLGMAKPLGKIFGYIDFMTLYATLLVLALGVAVRDRGVLATLFA